MFHPLKLSLLALCMWGAMAHAQAPTRLLVDAKQQAAEQTITQMSAMLAEARHRYQLLLENEAPGLHFYSMNQSASTLAICKNLGFSV